MKRIFILVIFISLIVAETSAQQTTQYKYHIFDDYLLNSAYVGCNDYYPVVVGRDQRFYGLSGYGPETYYLTLHSRVGEGYLFQKDGKINKFFEDFGNMALGFQLFQNEMGPQSETNIGITYGHYLRLNQNFKRKNKREVVLAVTPRFKRIGFDYSKFALQNEGLLGGEGSFYDAGLGEFQDRYGAWTFSTDVAALFRTVHGEFGLSALDIVQTKSKAESVELFVNDTLGYSPYDSLYPAKIVANVKLTFIEMYNSPKLDVKFVPSVAGIYAPKTGGTEFYVDLMLESRFKEHIAGVRSKVVFTGELGLSVYHTRTYNPGTFLQPYITFDFENITVKYAQTLGVGDNDLISADGVSAGGQIAILFKIANDRTIRSKRKVINWNK